MSNTLYQQGVYQYHYRILININNIFYVLVVPSPACGWAGLPQLFAYDKRHDFVRDLGNICKCLMLVCISKDTKQTPNVMMAAEFRPELSEKADWWPKQCPRFVNIFWSIRDICYMWRSGTVPKYGTPPVLYI